MFLTPDLRRRQDPVPDYEYALAVPGRVLVFEFAATIEALRVAPESQPAEYNPQQLLRADLLPEQLIVRNWRPGDRFWPAHTKSPKKIKELLQEKHAAQPGAQALARRRERRRDHLDARFPGPREVARQRGRASGADPGDAVGSRGALDLGGQVTS